MAAPSEDHYYNVLGTILTPKELATVYEWIASTSKKPKVSQKSMRLHLLYTTNTHARNVGTFHSRTDNRGPLLTVMSLNSGHNVGCYADDDRGYFGNSNGYVNDAGAFIFKIRSNGNPDLLKPHLDSNSHHSYCGPGYGPIHGGGNDLYVHADMSTVEFKPSTWKSLGVPSSCTANVIEVFKVDFTDDRPHVAWFEMDTTQKELEGLIEYNLRIQSSFPFIANIVLIGAPGVGKSSLINSIATVYSGFLRQLCHTGKGSGSVTKSLQMYLILALGKIAIWDTMGIESNADFPQSQLDYIIDGNVPSGTSLDERITMQTVGFRISPDVKEKMHCVVGVLSCLDASNVQALEKMKKLWLHVINDKSRGNLPMLILLTNVDKFDPVVAKRGVGFVNSSEKVKILRDKVSDATGVPRTNVFPVWNYSDEYKPELGKDVLAMMAMKRILECCYDAFQK